MQYTVNKLNHYTSVDGEPLSYDTNGNLLSAPGLTLQYDSWDRLISAATESNLVLFAYDGRHRCAKRVDIQNGLGRTTFMVWGHEPSRGWGLLEERGPNGELLARHVHGPSVDDLVLSELGGAVYYYHHDHLNSTIAVTDENGSVVEQYRYDVYGQPYFFGPDGTPRAESALGLRFLFTGREWLASLALYDYRHRVYSPSLGRFLQMDPLGFAAGEYVLYTHVSNSPLFQRDLFGLEPSEWDSIVLKIAPLARQKVPPGSDFEAGGYLISNPETGEKCYTPPSLGPEPRVWRGSATWNRNLQRYVIYLRSRRRWKRLLRMPDPWIVEGIYHTHPRPFDPHVINLQDQGTAVTMRKLYTIDPRDVWVTPRGGLPYKITGEDGK